MFSYNVEIVSSIGNFKSDYHVFRGKVNYYLDPYISLCVMYRYSTYRHMYINGLHIYLFLGNLNILIFFVS